MRKAELKSRSSLWVCMLLVIMLIAIILLISIIFPGGDGREMPLSSPGHHLLFGIGAAMAMYAEENNGQYPQADKWCDLLFEYLENREVFICPAALKKGDKSPCHYAMNPQCKPDSPPDTVLVFETKGGWNQHGGVELATTEYHDGKCCVLFNDYYEKAIADPTKLNWGTESADTK
jgi:hypothetical protein